VWSGFIWLRIGVIGVLWFQYNVWNLLTAWGSIGFPKRALFRGVS